LNDESFNIDDYNNITGYKQEAYEGENVKLELEPDEQFIYEYYTVKLFSKTIH